MLSLLDRGFVYAIAQVRGGQELGRRWYDSGRLLEKHNTFNDFIDVAKGLTELGYAEAGAIAAEGRSAGGELMGVIANQAPELFGAIVAGAVLALWIIGGIASTHVPAIGSPGSASAAALPLTPLNGCIRQKGRGAKKSYSVPSWAAAPSSWIENA